MGPLSRLVGKLYQTKKVYREEPWKKVLYTVANPARGLLNTEKKKKKKEKSVSANIVYEHSYVDLDFEFSVGWTSQGFRRELDPWLAGCHHDVIR